MARFVIQVIAAVAEQGRELLIDRTREGLALARGEGAVRGRLRMDRGIAARIITERDACATWAAIADGLTSDDNRAHKAESVGTLPTVMRLYRQMTARACELPNCLARFDHAIWHYQVVPTTSI